MMVNIGIPSGPTEDDGTPVALVAAVHEFGNKTNPERSFLRAGIRENLDKYRAITMRGLKSTVKGGQSVEKTLGMLGLAASSDVKKKITDGPFVANKASTIKRKGSSRPLIDTGQLRQSITWELSDDKR